jgi:hypothetical protein
MSTLRLTTISNQDGSATVPSQTVISGSAKAWVNFNGTGTVAIRAAFNVSSITDVGTGRYTVNFTNALADTNYASAMSARNASSNNINGVVAEIGSGYGTSVRTTTALGIVVMDSAAGAVDSEFVSVSIFR